MSKKIESTNLSQSVTAAIEAPYVAPTTKDAAAEKLMKFMQSESRLVRGIFQFFENPGATQKIHYKKYPTPAEMRKRGLSGGVEPFFKVMTDGREYEVPLYIAKYLNGIDDTANAFGNANTRNANIGTCSYPIHGFKYAGDSAPASQLGFGPAGEGMIPVPIIGITQRKKRFGFQSLEFAGVADYGVAA